MITGWQDSDLTYVPPLNDDYLTLRGQTPRIREMATLKGLSNKAKRLRENKVLAMLHEFGELTGKRISDCMPHGEQLKTTMYRLIRAGYVTARQHPRQRSTLYTLTGSGKAKARVVK
jgi:DNA-binding MarR family transcriptional regulator